MSEKVTQHPFEQWVEDSLGESSEKLFGSDVEVVAYGFDPGGSTELSSGADAAVATNPTLYFNRPVEASAHDEWTVRGLRYEQDGEAAVWTAPWGGRSETVIRLGRRTG